VCLRVLGVGNLTSRWNHWNRPQEWANFGGIFAYNPKTRV